PGHRCKGLPLFRIEAIARVPPRAESIDVQKLIRIKQRPAEGVQAVLPDQAHRYVALIRRWLAGKCQVKGAADLGGGIIASFATQPVGEDAGLLQEESAVEQVECLKLRRRSASVRGDLSGVGAMELAGG